MIKSIGAIRDSVLRHIQEQHSGKKPVEFHSLGVLAESREPGTHLVYSEGSDSGNSVQFRFRVVHLARWLGCWGKLEGEANSLLRQLVRKFGPLPVSLQQRVQDATLAQLEAWSLNILDARSLDEVFGD